MPRDMLSLVSVMLYPIWHLGIIVFLSHGMLQSDHNDLDQEKEMKDTSFAGGV